MLSTSFESERQDFTEMMSMPRPVLLTVLAIAGWLFPVPLVSAVPCACESGGTRCRCVVDPDFAAVMTRARLERAEAVFRATIVRIDTVAGPIGVLKVEPRVPWAFAARLRVTESWKGAVRDTTTLMLSRSSSCDVSLTWDSVYVVFAIRGATGRLTTRQCTGTTELRGAERDTPRSRPGSPTVGSVSPR